MLYLQKKAAGPEICQAADSGLACFWGERLKKMENQQEKTCMCFQILSWSTQFLLELQLVTLPCLAHLMSLLDIGTSEVWHKKYFQQGRPRLWQVCLNSPICVPHGLCVTSPLECVSKMSLGLWCLFHMSGVQGVHSVLPTQHNAVPESLHSHPLRERSPTALHLAVSSWIWNRLSGTWHTKWACASDKLEINLYLLPRFAQHVSC